MGWKAAKYITRREAEELASMGTRVKDMKDWELEELLQDLWVWKQYKFKVLWKKYLCIGYGSRIR